MLTGFRVELNLKENYYSLESHLYDVRCRLDKHCRLGSQSVIMLMTFFYPFALNHEQSFEF